MERCIQEILMKKVYSYDYENFHRGNAISTCSMFISLASFGSAHILPPI